MNGPLTEKDGKVSAIPATSNMNTAAKGEKIFCIHEVVYPLKILKVCPQNAEFVNFDGYIDNLA